MRRGRRHNPLRNHTLTGTVISGIAGYLTTMQPNNEDGSAAVNTSKPMLNAAIGAVAGALIWPKLKRG